LTNPTPLPTAATDTKPNNWRLGEHSVHFDPLLDSVVAIARIFGIATTQEALSAGLPLKTIW
jgi:ATP-binding cassette subfamily C protein LapB